MDLYNLDTEFSFGKHKGLTLITIAKIDPSYINWCLINIDDFCIEDYVIEDITKIKNDFKLSKNAYNQRDGKYQIWLDSQEEFEEDDFEGDGWDSYFENQSYERYNGSYAQSVEGLSDQFIDDVLDGDPDAYWNID